MKESPVRQHSLDNVKLKALDLFGPLFQEEEKEDRGRGENDKKEQGEEEIRVKKKRLGGWQASQALLPA